MSSVSKNMILSLIHIFADTLHAPPYLLTESALWQAYATLDKSKVGGGGTARILTDLVSLVRFAMHQENELVPLSLIHI